MREAAIIGVRALAGGTFVVLFTLVGEWLRPKSFAGLFAAAPSIAVASLLVTLVVNGEAAVWRSALGMVAGAVALVATCVVAIDSVKRFRAPHGSLAAIAVWFVVAGGLWTVTLR
jgi:hypothetical protein